MKKQILVIGLLLGLSSCITQPSAPLYSGMQPIAKKYATKRPVSAIKRQISGNSYKIVEVEQEKKVYHTVKPGEYVYSIARMYKVSPQEIIKNNNLKKPYYLEKGVRIFVKTETEKVKQKKFVGDSRLTVKNNNFTTRNYNKAKREVPRLPRRDITKTNTNKNIDFGYHKVKKGENLFRIGKRYGVSVFDLMAYNELEAPQDLMFGIELKIPVAKKGIIEHDDKVIEKTVGSSIEIPFIDKKKSKTRGFVYPVKGKIIQKFGQHGHGVRNDGVDIAVKIGTPVVAAESGTVKYSQELGTVGKMVLIKHRNGYITAYTHNSKLLVRKGQKVSKGQVIALSGNSGIASQPMLHFELRRYGKARNPVKYLR